MGISLDQLPSWESYELQEAIFCILEDIKIY